MKVNQSPMKIYALNILYIVLFFAASYITSLIAGISFRTMIILTFIVIIYWFLAITITGLTKKSINLKEVHLKTIGSLIVIMIVFIFQQLMFFNIPFHASFTFFAISLILLLLLHTVFFRLKFTN